MTCPHTQVRQWTYGDQFATTVHHVGNDGEERVELLSVSERMRLTLEADRGTEMVLPERARGKAA